MYHTDRVYYTFNYLLIFLKTNLVVMRAIKVEGHVDGIDLTDKILESGWRISVILNLVM